MSNFKYLFSPIKIGSMEVPNRLFMSPHGIAGYGPGSDAHAGYFEARAKGGCGLIGIACCWVQPPNGVYPGLFINACDKDHIPNMENIIKRIHKYDSKAFVQLTWATGAPHTPQPSREIPTVLWGDQQAREMSIEEIEQLIESHVISACNAQEAGADGIEIPMAGGAGMQVFSSPLYNHRTDQYGGSMENRLRVILEIVKRIKERCGRDFAIGLQPNVDESTMGGPGLDEGVKMAKMLADSGNVDWLRITARGQKPQLTQFHYPPSYFPQGTHMYAAAAVRDAVDNIPIIGGGRITSPEFAEQMLAEGQCDMVWAARSYIADPEWPNKAKRGETEEIRNCIGDLEGCFLRSCFGMPVGCTVNHEVCHEFEPLAKAEKSKSVVIAGAGPAGMNAAYYAAQRGHKVTLLEKRDALGGHVRMEAQLPGLTDRADLTRWLSLQLSKFDNVDIRLNTEATADMIIDMNPDAVIVATGSEYSHTGISYHYLTPVPGADADYVLTPEDILFDGKEVGDKVVIYDSTGYILGAGIAEMLADQGKDVTIVCLDWLLAKATSLIGYAQVIALRLADKVTTINNVAIREISDHTVKIQNILTFQEEEIEDVDTVIMVASRPSNDQLYHDLKGKINELYIIGDADDSRWNVFCIDDAGKAGKAVAMAL